jgi:hypothetical protein
MSRVTFTRTYAREFNDRYSNNTANYVTPQQRWNSVLNALPLTEKHSAISKLNAALRNFERRYPGIQSFSDPNFRLCRAIPIPMSVMCIDTTIQRYLDIDWVIKIIDGFTAYQAMPIQCYRVNPDEQPQDWSRDFQHWAAWDGQHTLVAFWIIATMVFKEDIKTVMVPTVEYDMRNRLECRTTFMNGNSKDGKKVMEPIDLAMQKIYAVKLDGVTDPDWVTVARKHDALASQDLFMTHSKFHDDREPGAISRPGDIVDDKFSVEMVRQFGVYADHVLNQQPRPVNTKELPIVMGFLRMAAMGNVTYSDDEIRGLGDLCIQLFDANFDEAGPFWDKVNSAYINWHKEYHADMDESLRPGVKLNKDWAQGGTFFWYQLRKSWLDDKGQAMRMPQLNISTAFRPREKDLW